MVLLFLFAYRHLSKRTRPSASGPTPFPKTSYNDSVTAGEAARLGMGMGMSMSGGSSAAVAAGSVAAETSPRQHSRQGINEMHALYDDAAVTSPPSAAVPSACAGASQKYPSEAYSQDATYADYAPNSSDPYSAQNQYFAQQYYPQYYYQQYPGYPQYQQDIMSYYDYPTGTGALDQAGNSPGIQADSNGTRQMDLSVAETRPSESTPMTKVSSGLPKNETNYGQSSNDFDHYTNDLDLSVLETHSSSPLFSGNNNNAVASRTDGEADSRRR